MQKDRVIASLRAIGLAAVAVGMIATPARAYEPQSPESLARRPQSVQPTTSAVSPPSSTGIIFVEVTPDTITTIKTAQNVITRLAFPQDAKQAICGDLFDAATNTGSFVIDHSGTDVYVKPVATKGQTNLFVKTDREVYNFDLVVVPAAQAFKVVNVNLPPYEQKIAEATAAATRELEQAKARLTTDMEQQLDTRRRELEQQAATDLAAEQKRLRTDADKRAADMATRRFVDGVLNGFTTVTLRERRGQTEDADVVIDDNAYVFEGRLYVRFRVQNRGLKEISFQEPRITVQGGDKDQPVTATIFTSRGDNKVAVGQAATGVAIFERPTLDKGERLVFVIRVGGDRVTLRLVDSQS